MEKIIVNAKEFKKGLATLKTLKAKKNDIDLLNFSVSENQLTVTRYVQASIDEKTSVSVTFLGADALENTDLTIATKDNLKRIIDCIALSDETAIEFSEYELSVNGFNFAKTELEYDAIDFEAKEKINFNTKDFQNAIKKCVNAIDKNQSARNILRNVLIKVNNGTADFLATDSHILAMVEKVACDNKNNFNIYLNVANNSDKAIAKLKGDNLELYFRENNSKKYFSITDGVTTVENVTENGNYPDLERLIPYKNDLVVQFDKKEFLSILKACGKRFYFGIDIKENKSDLLVFDEIKRTVENKIEFNTSIIDGTIDNRFTIFFTKKFAEKAFSIIDSNTIQMNLFGMLRPTTIIDGDTTALIAPFRPDEKLKDELGL